MTIYSSSTKKLNSKLANNWHFSKSRVLKKIDKIEKGEAKFIEQNHEEATYAKKISKIEGKINWKES